MLREGQPEQVVVFGSRVTGEADADSVLDVIVVAPLFGPMPFMLKMARFAKHVDFLCYAPAEFERIQHASAVVREALQHGERLYPYRK